MTRIDLATALFDLTPGHYTSIGGVAVHAYQDGPETPVEFGIGRATGATIAAYTSDLKLAIDWLSGAIAARDRLVALEIEAARYGFRLASA